MSDQAIVYREDAPPEDLRAFVHCFWQFRSDQETELQPILPDGRPELIIHLGTPYREVERSAPQSRIVFAGQLTKPLLLVPQGPTDIVAVRFRPDGARAILNTDMHLATNHRLDMETHAQSRCLSLLAPLWTTEGYSSRIDILSHYLRRITRDVTPDSLVRQGVSSIMDGAAHLPPVEISRRQYQRRFKTEVGISARDLQSIRRFRSIFDQLQQDQSGSWTQHALDAGYFDQPQMARDFRRFLGCSARQWIVQQAGLARKLSEAPG